MEKLKTKYILLTRHGERIDNINPSSQILPQDDPELTQKGKEQALKMGDKIYEYLKQKKNIKINSNNIIILSSPFSRTIQTSINLLKAFSLSDYESKLLHIDNKICELIFPYSVSNLPKKYLSIFIKPELNNTYFNKLEEFEQRQINIANINSISVDELPNRYESEKDVYLRLEKCFDQILNITLLDKELEIVNLVSHAGTINYAYSLLLCEINKGNKKLCDEIKDGLHSIEYDIHYCDTYVFKVIYDSNNIYTITEDIKLSLHK